MAWILLVISWITFAFSKELTCPDCPNICEENIFLSCDTCQCANACDNFCPPSQVCVLETVKCSTPCPKLPSCIDTSRVCPQEMPLFDDFSLIICNEDGIQCPLKYTCTPVFLHSFSVCCKSTEQQGVKTPGIDDPPFHPPLRSGPNFLPNEDEDVDCNCDLDIDMCKMATCYRHPDAICVSDPCTCSVSHVDSNGDSVICHDESNDIPNLPPIFRDSLGIPKDTHYVQGQSTTSEPQVGHIQNEYTPSPKHSPNELPSHQDKDSSGFPSLVLVVGGCILLLVLTITLIVFMTLYHQKKPTKHDEEQSKPLNDKPATNVNV